VPTLPYWLLGILGLAIVWLNALLIAASARLVVRDQSRGRRALGPVCPPKPGPVLLRGKVTAGDGEDGALAAHEIEQIGRATDIHDVPGIQFSDRAFRSHVYGGALEVDGKKVRVEGGQGEVWPAREAQQRVWAMKDDAQFDALYKDSKTAKGSPRVVRTALAAGDDVWVSGVLAEKDGELVLEGTKERPLFVSGIDPHQWRAKQARIASFFLLAELAVCAGLTRVALIPPYFEGWGTWSTLGGAALLVFFLGVQPIGVGIEEGARDPSRAWLRGEWKRSRPLGDEEKVGEPSPASQR
jgi:hypothetical protein